MSSSTGGYTYRDHKRCINHGWKPLDMFRCDECNTKLRTKPRNKPSSIGEAGKQFQIQVKRIR